MTPLLQKKTYNVDRIFRLAVSLALTVGCVWALSYLSPVLLPFVVGFLVAYVLHPLVSYVQRFLENRLAAVLMTFGLLLVLLAAAVALVVPQIASQMSDMARILSEVVGDGSMPSQLRGFVSTDVWQAMVGPLSQESVVQTLREQQVWQTAWQLLQKVAPGVLNVFSGILSALGSVLSLGIILLYIVFILLDFDKVQDEVEDLIPKAWKKPLLEFVHDANIAMSVYFRNRLLIALIQGVVFAIGFTLIGVPMGIVLGLAIGLASMIPYAQLLGIIPALLFGTLSAVDTGGSLLMITLAVIALFTLVQLLDDAVLTPRLMGKATGLSPAIILLSISVWGKLLGLLGLIIAIPMTCVLLAWYKRLND